MNAIEIYIDESGDFGPFDGRCPYYIVTMVFHESTEPLFALIQDLEYRLSLLAWGFYGVRPHVQKDVNNFVLAMVDPSVCRLRVRLQVG